MPLVGARAAARTKWNADRPGGSRTSVEVLQGQGATACLANLYRLAVR
jgi:hypothetical protein